MLDKSIPYKNIFMKIPRENITLIPQPILPEGYVFQFFKEGDEEHWARIETSVLEFDTETSAKTYFVRDYLPYVDELQKRCVFVVNPAGLPVATANAWFANSELGYQASLHWVSVCPEYQGLGLGKAVVKKAMNLFPASDPNCDVYLHTQTWSHKAVKIYHKLGFNLLKEERVALMSNDVSGTKIPPNEYIEAIDVLKNVIDEISLRSLIDNAI